MATDIDTSTSAFTKLFSVVVYLYFFTVLLFLFAFLLPQDYLPAEVLDVIPGTLDGAPVNSNTAAAIAIDLVLLSLFSILHIALARANVKKSMNLPVAAERSFFVLQAAICLHLTFIYWQNFELFGRESLWDVSANAKATNSALGMYAFGCVTLVSATFALDHFHLFGLTQGLGVNINKMLGLEPEFDKENECVTVRWHYKIVAHPIMTGFLIMFWSTPIMTMPHLLFATAMSLFIYVAVVHFEEPGMVSDCGAAYNAYLAKTPRFFPAIKTD